jgi:hypothetical protein
MRHIRKSVCIFCVSEAACYQSNDLRSVSSFKQLIITQLLKKFPALLSPVIHHS